MPDSDAAVIAVQRDCENCSRPLETVFGGYGHFDPKAQRYICNASTCPSEWHQIRRQKRGPSCPLCGEENDDA